MNNKTGKVLQNAPLKEVIFELHWELDFIPDQKIHYDTGFDEAVLNFRNGCQKAFPHFQLLAPQFVPLQALTNKVTHRFFKEKNKHPIFQLGPGVFTVNDNNKNYSWNEFRQLIIDGIQCLKASYAKELVISSAELRYIDAVSCSVLGNVDKFEFLREHLNINAESYKFVDGQLTDINFAKRFVVGEDAYLAIMVATGKDNHTNEDLVIWHTAVINKERIIWDKLEEWLDKGHSICSRTFKNMVNDQLYEHFS